MAIRLMHKTYNSDIKYDCQVCIESKARNAKRGRDCALEKTDHIIFSSKKTKKQYKVRNKKRLIRLINALSCKVNAPERYLNQIGRGVCPKSVPIDSNVSWWIELVDLCCGGYSGYDIIHLPFQGSMTDQPFLFFQIRSVLMATREKLRKEYKKEPVKEDK